MPSLPSIISLELLFWLPTIQDLILLVFTYGSFHFKGYEWYFEQMDAARYSSGKATRKKDDGDTDQAADGGGGSKANDVKEERLSSFAMGRVEAVWELAMIAYGAYGVLLPLATYWCYRYPPLRVDFCWAMSVLMLLKVFSLGGKGDETSTSKRITLFLFYFPTYGGYAIVKTFFSPSD